MGTLTATRYYCGNSTPEGMDVDKGPQELAMRVILAALVDKHGKHPHRFQSSEWVHPKGGTREWRALAAMDDERWRDFKVSVAEIEEFERSPAFDFYVALMGGVARDGTRYSETTGTFLTGRISWRVQLRGYEKKGTK